jgi:two-component sensor histidine kinase
MQGSFRQRWRQWALFVSFWTLIGVSFASQFYFSSAKEGWGISWTEALKSSLGDWYLFGLLSVPVIWLARRFSLEKGGWSRALLTHVAGCALFSTCYVALRAWIALAQTGHGGPPASFRTLFEPLFFKTFQYNVWVYWVIVAVTHAFDYYQKFHERELRGAELERNLAEAKLKSLQIQLNPHFLFNTLHSISALMHRDVEQADAMLAKLSGLLRKALDGSDQQEVTLSEELDFLGQYLDIEKTRFGDRLHVEFEIAEETKAALIPNLILQPIVENAIRHGVEPRTRPGRIVLRSFTQENRLILEVEDNGPGLPKNSSREGIGLSNTKARLKALHGTAGALETASSDTGAKVRITVPFRHTRQEARSAFSLM